MKNATSAKSRSSSTAPLSAGSLMAAGTAALDPVTVVRSLLSTPESALDYAAAKLVLDKLVDPPIDAPAALMEIERLTELVRNLAGPSASAENTLLALRKALHESGPWNDNGPFAYDHSDPLGQNPSNSLLSNYLTTRRGNCVSMPILFLILSERLGLDAWLSTAPLHLFVRHRDQTGRVFNLETTSGGLPARDAWYAANLPMTPTALKNGLYMRSLTRREAIAHMANVVVEHLLFQKDYEAAIGVAGIILQHWPSDAHAMVKQASAFGYLLEDELRRLPPSPSPALQQRIQMLARKNDFLFRAAEDMGWRPLD